MKKFSIIAVLVLAITIFAIPAVCFADAAGSYSLSSVWITMTEPEVGEYTPLDIKATLSNSQITDISWKDSNGYAYPSSRLLVEGTYTLSFTLKKTGGDAFAARTTYYINSSSDNIAKTFVNANEVKLMKTFNITKGPNLVEGTRRVKTVDISIPEPETGKNLASNSEVKFSHSFVEIINAGWSDDEQLLSSKDVAGYGCYSLRLFFKPASTFSIDDEVNVYLNGVKKKVSKATSNGETQYYIEQDYYLTTVNRVDFKDFDFPLAGQTYSTTGLEVADKMPVYISKSYWGMFNKDITGTTASRNENVGLVITVKTKVDYGWGDNQPEAYLNGKKADTTTDAGDGGYTFQWNYRVEESKTIKVTDKSAETVEFLEGKDVKLFVKADNAKSYQWFYLQRTSTPRAVDTSKTIDGATSSEYIIKNAGASEDGKQYGVIITGNDGATLRVSTFTLKMLTKSDLLEVIGEAAGKIKLSGDIASALLSGDAATIARPSTSVSRPSTSTSVSRPTSTATTTTSEGKSGDATITRPTTSTSTNSRPTNPDATPTRPTTTKTSGDTTKAEDTSKKEETTKKEETSKTEEPVQKIVWASASKWAIDELNKANDAGVIPTVLDKEDLTKNITRKEFAHVAVKLYEKVSGKKAEAVSKNPFKDTKDTEVLKAFNVGITKGISDTEFAPDTEITREQMATMMTRALTEAKIDTNVDLTKVKEFSDDNLMHNWSRSAIYFMSNVEIIKGMGDNTFGVNGNATREQSIIISIRSVEKFAK